MGDTPYAIPLPQPSGPPQNVTLEAVDGSTLRLGFDPPASNGGGEVDRYAADPLPRICIITLDTRMGAISTRP